MNILKSGRPSRAKEQVLDMLNDKELTVRLNLNISKNFSKKIKAFALEKDITVKELIIRSLNEYIDKN